MNTVFKASIFCFLVVVLLFLLSEVKGHGRLLEPPNRSSIWRLSEFQHLNPPRNYDDNGMNCGGFWLQHGEQGGKCGPCGDPFNQPRPRANEGGGRYGRGIIVRNYTVGQEIEIFVELTANHKGYFELRLCPHNSPDTPASENCFAQNILPLADGSGTKYFVESGLSIFEYKVKLPDGLRCSQCVLQWHYLAGNNWGVCADGTGALGCGPQETFRACSDVAIY